MLFEDVVSYLEMTSPRQLRPAASAATPAVHLWKAGAEELPVIRETHDRIAGPHDWESLRWSDAQWREHLSREGVHTWIAEVDGLPVGLTQLQAQPGGDVEIEFFGLAPEFIGKGLGGALLTETTRLAWSLDPVDATPVRRVWLRTSAYDHPNARPAYLARGFRHYNTETRQRDFTRPPV